MCFPALQTVDFMSPGSTAVTCVRHTKKDKMPEV